MWSEEIQNHGSRSQKEMFARNRKRILFDFKLQNVLKNPKSDEIVDEGVLYYRWHYSDSGEDDSIQTVANRPSMRWLLYTTALQTDNIGKFFYSTNQEDLVVDPTDPTRPRIGPYAPPIRTSADVTMTQQIRFARVGNITTFERRLKAAVAKAKKNNEPFSGKIHCRWYFTDMQQPTEREVKSHDNTQTVRDLFTEYQVRYPNQFWASCNEQDMVFRLIDGIRRPQQGLLLPTGEGPRTLGASASAASSTSTAGRVRLTNHHHLLEDLAQRKPNLLLQRPNQLWVYLALRPLRREVLLAQVRPIILQVCPSQHLHPQFQYHHLLVIPISSWLLWIHFHRHTWIRQLRSRISLHLTVVLPALRHRRRSKLLMLHN